MSKIVSGDKESFDRFPENMNINDLIYFKYALITFVDIKHSFTTLTVISVHSNLKTYKNVLPYNAKMLTVKL